MVSQMAQLDGAIVTPRNSAPSMATSAVSPLLAPVPDVWPMVAIPGR